MPSRIEDYALIGDCLTAALVGLDGSIDWLCLPRFDSGACFAALLGDEENGRFKIAPEHGAPRVKRRYREGTLVLETDFETDDGLVTVIDLMPPMTDVPEVVRLVVGKRGRVPMRMELVIRFDYGASVPWVRHTEGGIVAVAGPDMLHLDTPIPVRGEDFRTVGSFTVAEGDHVPFIMSWHPSHMAPPKPMGHEQALAQTEKFWRAWSGKSRYNGHYREAVMRSLLTLKALTYAPTGGIVAAPTTSLPEWIGGVRNWDYRFCWLRDATLVLYALMYAGYREEAFAWREWLLRAIAGKPSQAQVMYGIAGERRLPEIELDWLSGYEGSRPVRIGNAAARQMQLDVYGEVMDALHLGRRLGLTPSHEGWRLQRALMRFLETAWVEPDHGMWEVRGPPRHFTHSKVMAWVAADRAVKAVEMFGRQGPVDRWRALRATIHEEVCQRAFDPELNSFVQYYGGKMLDASLLLIPTVGFLPPTDPRVRGTVEAVERHLMRDGFVARYTTHPKVDGLPPSEGAFLACSFWLADSYLLLGRERDARALFERLLGRCNDVGLLSEEIDPLTGRFLGNFPQAFSHVALINTARNLSGAGGPCEDRTQEKPASIERL
jgi:GH15 family glucan-1,4-alpha-glucosidase